MSQYARYASFFFLKLLEILGLNPHIFETLGSTNHLPKLKFQRNFLHVAYLSDIMSIY